MKTYLLFALFFVLPVFSFADDSSCLLTASQLNDYLKLDYQAFDQTLPDGGWRGLALKGCELEATKLVEIYHLHHLEDLEVWQARVLYWHAGQVYAELDLTDLALTRFRQSYDSEEKPDDTFKWNSYVKGSIAFLEHDMKSLVKARDELRVVNQTRPNPNFKILEAFVRCFNKTYREAYNPSCK